MGWALEQVARMRKPHWKEKKGTWKVQTEHREEGSPLGVEWRRYRWDR